MVLYLGPLVDGCGEGGVHLAAGGLAHLDRVAQGDFLGVLAVFACFQGDGRWLDDGSASLLDAPGQGFAGVDADVQPSVGRSCAQRLPASRQKARPRTCVFLDNECFINNKDILLHNNMIFLNRINT